MGLGPKRALMLATVRVAFREILGRLPEMHYANGGPVMAPSALVRSFQHMDVVYERGA